MRIKPLLFSLLIAFFFHSQAQSVHVVDNTGSRPVADAFIYHENKEDIAYTDENGDADIADFPTGLIFIQHPSFHRQSVAYFGSNIRIVLREKIMSFNEVVISANKWEQEEESVTQEIMSISKKTIQFQNPQTSADLLANTGQVFVQKSQYGGGSPKIRGFSANSVLLVVDGVRMNNAIFRSGNLQNIINIDPNALESSEVIFGPGAVIYGSDALGGVMDFHTVSPRWTSTQKFKVGANALMRYSTAANERTGHIDFQAVNDQFSFFHSSSVTFLDDLRAGAQRRGGYANEFERNVYVQRIDGQDHLIPNSNSEIQKFSGYDLFNTLSKVKYRLSENMDISYGFYFSTTSDIPRYDNLTETIRPDTDSLASAEWYYGPQQWQMHNLSFNLYQENPFFDQARVTLAYQQFDESRNDRNFGDDRLRVRSETVDMYSLGIDFDKEWKKSNLYYGIDFYHNDATSDAYRRNIETGAITAASSRYPNEGSEYTSFALYGSFVDHINDKLTFNSGLRYNIISLQAQTTDSTALSNQASALDLSNVAFNGSLGLAYNFSEKSKISYNFATGFRAPNIDDVGKVFDVGSSIVVPNPGLKPEYTLNNEIAYQRKTERSLLRLVVFQSRLFNAIVDGPFTLNGNSTIDINGETLDVFAKVNAGDAVIYGGSLVYHAEIEQNWAVSQVVSFTGGRDISNDEPLRHTTPLFGRTTVTYQKDKLRSELYMEYNTSRDREDIPSSEIDRKPYLYTDSGSPGWYTLNLKSSYQLSEFININVGLENILDTHYRPYSSGISAPGLNLILTVRASI